MLDKEILYLLSEQTINKDVYDKKFLDKLVTTLNKSEYFENLSTIKTGKTSLLIEADTLDNEITLYTDNIYKSYNNALKEYGVLSPSRITKNIYELITLIHELTHVYQHNLYPCELKSLFLECIKIKEGYVLMNGLLDKIVIKSCNKLNLETLRELYITLVSCNLYFKNHHLFPSERMADGYAFSTIAQIYNILGSAYFKDYKDFKELIYYELKKEYIKIKDKIITPYNRFTQILSSYGYEITCIDINKIDVYNRVLSGLEEDINNIDMVINTKILTKQV